MLNEDIKNKIVTRITDNLKVKNIILFGSYANGKPHEDSDIDLVVILDEHGFSQTFKERIEKRQKVSHLFFDMRQEIAMDFLVYTTEEWQRVIQLDTSFIREIKQTGINLI